MRIWLAIAAVAALTSSARADDDDMKGEKGRPVDKGTIGVGIILGEPTGVCAKLYLKDDQAVQIALGSAFITGGLQAHADYVFHPWILQDKESFVLPVYIGPGVRFIDYSSTTTNSSHAALGARAVIGLLFDFKNVPLDAFIEVAGVLEYDFGKGKGTGVALNGGGGIRYYF
jgi:hypothetical protein